MPYYHDLITEKSWRILQNLRRAYDFILIGGWAVYLYTHGLKSRDIDFICDYKTLEKLRNDYDLVKNDRLRKYEIHIGEFDIDIYVPFFSDLGIPVEDLQNIASGISGIIDINGTLHCYNGQNEIRVPVDGKVCFVAEATRGQRRVMELEVYKTAEGEQMVRWIAGIEPLQEYVVYDSRGTIKSTIHLTPIEGKIVLKAEAEKQKAREEAKEEENNRRLGQSRIVKNPLGAQRFFG